MGDDDKKCSCEDHVLAERTEAVFVGEEAKGKCKAAGCIAEIAFGAVAKQAKDAGVHPSEEIVGQGVDGEEADEEVDKHIGFV